MHNHPLHQLDDSANTVCLSSCQLFFAQVFIIGFALQMTMIMGMATTTTRSTTEVTMAMSMATTTTAEGQLQLLLPRLAESKDSHGL